MASSLFQDPLTLANNSNPNNPDMSAYLTSQGRTAYTYGGIPDYGSPSYTGGTPSASNNPAIPGSNNNNDNSSSNLPLLLGLGATAGAGILGTNDTSLQAAQNFANLANNYNQEAQQAAGNQSQAIGSLANSAKDIIKDPSVITNAFGNSGDVTGAALNGFGDTATNLGGSSVDALDGFGDTATNLGSGAAAPSASLGGALGLVGAPLSIYGAISNPNPLSIGSAALSVGSALGSAAVGDTLASLGVGAGGALVPGLAGLAAFAPYAAIPLAILALVGAFGGKPSVGPGGNALIGYDPSTGFHNTKVGQDNGYSPTDAANLGNSANFFLNHEIQKYNLAVDPTALANAAKSNPKLLGIDSGLGQSSKSWSQYVDAVLNSGAVSTTDKSPTGLSDLLKKDAADYSQTIQAQTDLYKQMSDKVALASRYDFSGLAPSIDRTLVDPFQPGNDVGGIQNKLNNDTRLSIYLAQPQNTNQQQDYGQFGTGGA